MAKDNWKNSNGGDFAIGSNWSSGVPGSSDTANINAAGVTSSANETADNNNDSAAAGGTAIGIAPD